MIDLNSTTDITTIDVDYDPMEAFYLHHVLPGLVIEYFMDSSFSFNENFLTVLSDESGLSGKMVWSIANNIRKPEYSESLKALVEMITDRVDVSDRMDMLDDSFCETVERLIIRSKHNDPVRKIADASYVLVEQIFDDNGSTLRSYRSVRKCQVKKVVVYILLVVITVYLKHNLLQKFVA